MLLFILSLTSAGAKLQGSARNCSLPVIQNSVVHCCCSVCDVRLKGCHVVALGVCMCVHVLFAIWWPAYLQYSLRPPA
jgi:hypothetical protein